MNRTWAFEKGRQGVNVDAYCDEGSLQLILVHSEPDTADGKWACDYAHCPRLYRDLPHFVLFDYGQEPDVRRYAFELKNIKRFADTLLEKRHKTVKGAS